jgi:transposase InsO family protein
MVWTEKSTVSLRQEFVNLARQEGVNMRALCRQFGISPKTGYKWLARFEAAAGDGQALHDRSRRPRSSPLRSPDAAEQAVLALRQQHPAWGGRKIARRLVELGQVELAPSTVTHILHRHGLISPAASREAQPWQRFEHEAPNLLWQIDFKGHFATLAGPCHALTLLDDHSRFNLLLHAGRNTSAAQVQPLLYEAFMRYGLPLRINADNGPPWGSCKDPRVGLTQLTVWLIRLGVRISHSRPHHPQTNGKLERFHRSLDVEVLAGRHFADHAEVQRRFDAWRLSYNCERPHEALELQTPVQRYRPSGVPMPASLPAIDYPDTDEVAKVRSAGFVTLAGRRWRVSQALVGLPIAARRDEQCDGVLHLYFCHHRFATLDLREPHELMQA